MYLQIEYVLFRKYARGRPTSSHTSSHYTPISLLSIPSLTQSYIIFQFFSYHTLYIFLFTLLQYTSFTYNLLHLSRCSCIQFQHPSPLLKRFLNTISVVFYPTSHHDTYSRSV